MAVNGTRSLPTTNGPVSRPASHDRAVVDGDGLSRERRAIMRFQSGTLHD
jgi:hypothetical protein